MEDKIDELETRTINMAEKIVDVGNDLEDLKERVAALEKALATLSNTLHVIDATSLLALYSLIKTDNLRQPNFTNNQDIIDSGCSDAINRMLKTVMKVNAAEAARKSKQTKAIKDMMEKDAAESKNKSKEE